MAEISPSIESALKRFLDAVRSELKVEAAYLFGSVARGVDGPDSDIDLLVVMPVEGSRLDKAVEIGIALHDIRVPKDIIVTTPEDFEWRKDIVGTIERPAAMEGETLYAKK